MKLISPTPYPGPLSHVSLNLPQKDKLVTCNDLLQYDSHRSPGCSCESHCNDSNKTEMDVNPPLPPSVLKMSPVSPVSPASVL
jgi:hypothetical protein